MICIDTSDWIERLLGGSRAAGYNRGIEAVAPDDIVTSVVTIYEVYRNLRPVKGEAAALETVVTLRATRIIPVDHRIALEAADYNLARGLDCSDALVYATAGQFGAELHTSDPDLKGIPGVVFHDR